MVKIMVVTADVEMAVGAVTEAMTETSMAEAVRVVGRAVATAVVTAGAVGVRGRGGRARWRQRFERIKPCTGRAGGRRCPAARALTRADVLRVAV